ncbi:MAG TPA: DUF87 domain-containing protein [Verrucomicrobiae bacterium]|nr:DUF87 domain-containing protein [Verrucomicrobiae bacterium]
MNYGVLLHKLLPLLPIVSAALGVLVVLYVLLVVSYRLLQWRRAFHQQTIWLELTPPAHTIRTARSTQELFAIIHGFRHGRSFRDKLLHHEVILSLEIVSTRKLGIRYLIQVDRKLAGSLHQIVTSYLPEIKVAEVEAPASDAEDDEQVMEFKQTEHYAFPFAAHRTLDEHDPVAYLTGMMTKLLNDEQIRFQIILTPVRLREANILARKILGNEDLLAHLSGHSLPFVSRITGLLSTASFGVADAIGEVYHGSTKQSYSGSYDSTRANYESLQVAKRQRPTRTLSAFELEVMESMHRKLNQPLFRVSIRAAVSADDPQTAKDKLSAIKSSLQSYGMPPYQTLSSRVSMSPIDRLRHYEFTHRLPSLFARHALVLSASEVASLYHFPISDNSRTDNLVTSLSRTLAAPISLKQDKKLGVIIGQNEHHGISTPIGLTEAERERHVYIIGGTGNGKTTMLQYQIVQDMQNGKGLAVIDPHGDMAETLLTYVPPERINDVVYFNPDDISYPIGLNLLELREGLTGDELLQEKDLITESVISVFRKIFSEEDTGGHRIEYVLRNTIQTALTVKDATLFTVFDLLNDPKYRRSVIRKLDNKDLKNFWKNELGKAGDMQKVKMSAGITAKIGRFLFSASAKRVLEQPKSTIDFDDIINGGKILICNFSKGLIGEDTSELFGITVLAKLQLASLRRARLAQSERRAFYLYVDEFQNFATQSFVQMLSESRKYKLFMTMAEQSTSQQKDQQMIDIILANVGTVICFRTGNPQDEKLLLPLFTPYIAEGEISNLSPFNFYARLSATTAQEPLSGKTLLLEGEGNNDVAIVVIENSRMLFAKKVEPEEQEGANPEPVADDDVPAGEQDIDDALPDEA